MQAQGVHASWAPSMQPPQEAGACTHPVQAQCVQEGGERLHDHQHAQGGAEEDEEGCGEMTGGGVGWTYKLCRVAQKNTKKAARGGGWTVGQFRVDI